MRTRRSSIKALTGRIRRLRQLLATLVVITLACSTAAHVPAAHAATYTDHNRWMADMAGTIGQRPLKQVVIPGSHDTGTYGYKTSPRITDWAYAGTQNKDMDITAQLKYGVRAFDVRARFEQNGSYPDWYIYHGTFISATDLRLRDLLSELTTWVNEPGHEKEIVILDMGGTTAPDTNNAQQVESFTSLCDGFLTGAGNALLTPDQIPAGKTLYDMSLNEIWALPDHPRIITNWNGCGGAAGWPADASTNAKKPVDSWYANQCYATQYFGAESAKYYPGIIPGMTEALKARAKAQEASDGDAPTTNGDTVTGLYTLYIQATTTNDCLIYLHDFSYPATIATRDKLKEWYRDNQNNTRQNLNILSGDYVEETQLVETALAMNHGAAIVASATTADRQAYTAGSPTGQPVTISFTCTAPTNAPSSDIGWYLHDLRASLLNGRDYDGVTSDNMDITTLTHEVTLDPAVLGSGVKEVIAECSIISGRTSKLSFLINFPPPPTITPNIIPATPYGTNGWYTVDTVQVTWAVDDNGSPISSSGCDPTSIVADTAGTTLTCAATNLGGTASQSVTIKRDATAPTIDASAKNADGSTYTPDTWTNQAVTVRFTCADAISGLATVCPTGQIISAEGVKQTIPDISVTDNAGNIGSLDFGPIKIDTTKPTITAQAAPAPNAKGWNNTDVTVAFSCDDSLSKIATCSPQKVLSADGAAQSAIGTAVDNAGNSGTATVSGINIDKTAPTISAGAKKADGTGYSAGTWTNQSVTVQFTCADATSKVASCSPSQTFSTDGVTESVGGTAQDNADNSATASFGLVKLDKTRPTVTYSGNAGSYTPDQTITITCTAADSLSGVASSTCKNISGPAYSFVVGTNSFSAQATDNAGNLGAGTTSFTLKVTSSSLSTVINQFVTDASVAQSLIIKANEIATAPNAGSKANKLQAFISLVQAQTGKSITQAQADILTKLARGL